MTDQVAGIRVVGYTRRQDQSETMVKPMLEPYRRRSTPAGLLLVGIDILACIALFWGLLVWHSVWLRSLLACLEGVVITRLFILGHDACHGSLFPSALLNAVLGRIAFLPSLHPYSLWEKGHNNVHHAFTNLKGIDFIWIPLSVSEYVALSPFARARQRFYRTLPGMGVYYFVEVWIRYLTFHGIYELRKRAKVYFWDCALVSVFAITVLAGLSHAGYSAVGSWKGALIAVFWCLVAPMLVWNQLMGFIVFNHHNHPGVLFFNKRAEWSFYNGQVKGSTHVVFPWPMNRLLHGIMEHTAHHLDVKVPCYHLKGAQAELERRLRDELILERWTLSGFLYTVRCCKLYDYDKHIWLGWDGRPSVA
jgi:acyl-lipid omega-6 desaturase (Delta-12 desaturase)